MDTIDKIWDAHLRKIGAIHPNPNNDSLRVIASEISSRYPVGTADVYRALVNLIDAFEVAIQSSMITGHDASVLMNYFVCNAAKGIKDV